MRVMTLNIAHGRGNSLSQLLLSEREIRHNLDQIASLLKDQAPDVVALQEADGPCAWSGSFDHVAYLAEQSGLTHHWRGEHGSYSWRTFHLTYGTALLSQKALDHRHSQHFGLSWRDSKGYVSAQFQNYGQNANEAEAITFVSLHLDFLRHMNRKDQLSMIEQAFAGMAKGPVVVMGDFNCSWQSNHGLLKNFCRANGLHAYQPRASLPTFPSRAPRRRLDWILCSESIHFKSHSVINIPISDHCAVIADLELRRT
jgi:endonuclease/exonuclease/phosphatase family metal-dependent hydrolase